MVRVTQNQPGLFAGFLKPCGSEEQRVPIHN